MTNGFIPSSSQLSRLLNERMRDYERHYAASIGIISPYHDSSARARELLLASLSPKQRADFEQHNHFFVTGPSKIRYRIRYDGIGNVDEIDWQGRGVQSWCGVPDPLEYLPIYDQMLAQKLSLETDDAAFKRVANRMLGCSGHVILPPTKFSWRSLLPVCRPYLGMLRTDGFRLNMLCSALNLAMVALDIYGDRPYGGIISAFSAGASLGFGLFLRLHRRP